MTTENGTNGSNGTKENRESFFARLRPLLAPSELRKAESAYTFSKFEHRAQTRRELDDQGKPVRYFEHPRSTVLILVDEIGCVDIEMICILLLHDTLEDTRLTAEQIEYNFGAVVARAVIRLTKIPKDGFYGRLLRYGTWRELLAKCVDQLHNLRSLISCQDLAFQEKQVRGFWKEYPDILDRLEDIVPRQYHDRCVWLQNEMVKTVLEVEQIIYGQNHQDQKSPQNGEIPQGTDGTSGV